MNKKKLTIIACSVMAVLVAGLLVNNFFNWPIDNKDTSGDISKANRFSREMESADLSNMEELLKTDSTFKDGIVAAQVVMQTRATQFGTLVDMSNEVASNIAAFAEVLKDMNATREMVNNVVNSLVESSNNLDAALGGEKCPDLSQSAINASLAYTTLQKQNNLANRFIETTDKYLETANGDDQLKFVRDQWLEYQQMTAALEGNKASAEALAKKGNLLSGEQALAAMSKANLSNQLNIIASANLAQSMNVETKLASTISKETLENICSVIRSAAEATMQSMAAGNAIQSTVQAETLFGNTVKEAIKSVSSSNTIASRIAANLANASVQKIASAEKASATLASKQNSDKLGMSKGVAIDFDLSTIKFNGAGNIISSFNSVNVFNSQAASSQNALCHQASQMISQTVAAGNVQLNNHSTINK